MTPQSIRVMASIMAAQARIEGMKVANLERESQGYAFAYDADDFFVEAQLLEQLSI